MTRDEYWKNLVKQIGKELRDLKITYLTKEWYKDD